MKPAYLLGSAMWSTGIASQAKWRADDFDAAMQTPTCSSVKTRHLRYTSVVTRMALNVFEQVTTDKDVNLGTLGVVFASSFGEIQIAVKLLDSIDTDGAPSPASFMNSVHNTAPGHLSIACRNHGISTAIAAGSQTVSSALLEAMLLLQESCSTVALVLADEEFPEVFNDSFPSLAVCLLLQAKASSQSLCTLDGIRIAKEVVPVSLPHFAGNPIAPAASLLQAIASKKPGPHRLDLEQDEGWCVSLSFPE
ncbi:MAG: beta-ketoacyl synthase chain length factor [Myxococcales bacterium]|nr:beta-ketoacyl synthase chain length factor [Myxococcales bacterium]